jgi:membrane-associated phospholipid phosphatase
LRRSSVQEKIARTALILLPAFLQLGTYHPINSYYSAFTPSDFIQVETVLDSFIPYWPWTWPIYYFGFFYPLVWAVVVVWRLSWAAFTRTIVVFTVMITTGALLRLIVPTHAPWPEMEVMGSVQQTVKALIETEPLACLPSMHVAIAFLPAFMSIFIFRSLVAKYVSVGLAVLISVSTMTAKEHWILDVFAGLMLAICFFVWWYYWAYRPPDTDDRTC